MGHLKNLKMNDGNSFERKDELLNNCFGCNYKAYQPAIRRLNDEYCVWMPKMAKTNERPFSKNDQWINIYQDDYIIEKRVDGNIIEQKNIPNNRIVFMKNVETNKYCYAGVYVQDDENCTDYEHFYKRIKRDIDVEEWNVVEKILFCNIAYMREYDGLKEDDIPVNGGKYVRLHHDASEKWNFSNYSKNKMIRGFVETKYKDGFESGKEPKTIHLEHLDPFAKEEDKIDGVKVIFVAKKYGVQEKVVVGWYDNATVYRNRQHYDRKGEKISFNIETKKKDVHLVSEDIREYLNVPMARISGFGMGQSNVWYAGESKKGREFSRELIQKIEYYTSSGIEEIEDERYIRDVNEWQDSITEKSTYKEDIPKSRKDTVQVTGRKKYPHNPQIGRNALILANHKCEIDNSHKTFKRKSRDEDYTEPHHLVPLSQYDKFDKDIDVEANIVSLCCNCHKKIHLGKASKEMVEALYYKRKDRLKAVGINISLEDLLEMY